MYAHFLKRLFDFLISLTALLLLSPLLIVLTVIGAVTMKGNPFFIQLRPGKISKKTGKEKIFRIIKFRTMSNAKDTNGNLLPDEVRLNKYGKFLRKTSLDELPELVNIIKGDMAIVGPRPLLVKYLPYYTEEQHRRHDVRPGLTGYAQTHGRNGLDWDEKLHMDQYYVGNITLTGDVKILIDTVKCVIKSEGISQKGQATMEDFVEYTENKRKISADGSGH